MTKNKKEKKEKKENKEDENKITITDSEENSNSKSEIIESIIAVVLVAIIIIGLTGFAKGWFTSDKDIDNPETRYQVTSGNKPLLGSNDAKVLIVEFSNYKCSHCKDFAINTLPKLKEKYIDNVDNESEDSLVAFAYRDFTLPNVISAATKASIAAECAFRQGEFWNYNEQLYNNQDKLDDIIIRKIAENLDFDMVKFEACLKDDNAAMPMANDYTEGANLRISGTPTFFVNGKRVVGAKSFEEFSKIIDEEIARVDSLKENN